MDEKIISAVEKSISTFCEIFYENPDRWENERESVHDFYQILFDNIPSHDMKTMFKWEYLVGKPSYAKGNYSAAVDIALVDTDGQWVGIEIEYGVGIGKQLKKEIGKCIDKFTNTEKAKEIVRGYIIPLIHVKRPDNKARGYDKTKRRLLKENMEFNEYKNIVIRTDGIRIEEMANEK